MQARRRGLFAAGGPPVVPLLVIAAGLAIVPPAPAQITRDVGHIAVVEGDSNIIFTPRDTNGLPCGPVSVNVAEMAKKFYRTHGNNFHSLIMFTNFSHLLLPDADCTEQANAFQQPVANAIKGIGLNTYDVSATYGSSGGVLAGVLNMGDLTARPSDPMQRLPGNNDSMLSLLGQEFGHNWGASVEFDSDTGPTVNASKNLLGRDGEHWSFFFHTASATSSSAYPEASSLEGNFWNVDTPTPGQFQTATVTDGFSPLDLYLMGFLPADQVGQLWYISGPTGVTPAGTTAASAPSAGAQAGGGRTFLSIEDIIAVEGNRQPDVATSPKILRQAFILLTRAGVDVTQAQIDQLERLRVTWESYFTTKTQTRGAVVATPGNVIYVSRFNTGAEDGTLDRPFNTITEGRDRVAARGTVVVIGGSYPERDMRFTAPLTLRAVLGAVTIGD